MKAFRNFFQTSAILSLTGLLLWAHPEVSAADLILYVAPNGNDRWSGTRADPDSNRSDGPLATPAAALQAARLARAKATGAPERVTVILRGGVYELDEPLRIGPDDSGIAAERPFTIAAYPNEKPVLSGGRRIAGWSKVSGKSDLWTAEIPAVREGKWHFRQLFVNGQRRPRARTPNQGFFRIQGPSPQDKPVRIPFKAGEIKKEWADRGDVELIALLAWADLRMPIRSVDETNHVAILAGDPRPSNRENNARYYIENAPDALDIPGEWYLDRRTGKISCLAFPGEDLARAEVIAPRLEELLVLQGDTDGRRPVRHVEIRGLTFSFTDWSMGENGYADTQAAVATRGDVRAEMAVDCVLEDCTFSHLGGYAIEIGKGCQRWSIRGNEMFDLGAGGVRIGETAKRVEAFEQNHSHTVSDNHIHQAGIVYPPAVGVFILQSGKNRVAHNHIHHLFYTAISVGWNWGYQETPCRENVIEFNHLHDLGQDMLSDMGAVYTLGIQKGTVIRNNLIHDVTSFTYGGWGLYPDEGSSEILFENNVVFRCKSAGFHQHYGRDNIVRNNIFAFNREHQLMRTREEAHRSFYFTNNIVYFDSGDLLGSNWKNDKFHMDGNIYFDARPGATAASMRFAGATFEEWRARGHDLRSRIADPLFVAPARLDFSLRANSPALELGFKPIEVSSIGVRPKGRRD
ncbi:MAG: right-handed parallel beta-helix repeat-containing protein [Verrucomicrobiota bacterium]